jgi:hypothetical protein
MPSRQPAGTPALPRPSAADKVDDFQLIAFGQVSCGPLFPRHDVAIQFHSHAILLHAELFDQQSQCKGSKGLFLAVYDYFHWIDSRNLRVKRQAETTSGQLSPRDPLGVYFSQLKLAGGGTARVAGLH